MAIHSNQASKGGPSSGDSDIRGHNPTYLSKVQKESRGRSSTKPGGNNQRKKDLSVDGSSRTTSPTDVKPGPSGFGSGYYVPNKG